MEDKNGRGTKGMDGSMTNKILHRQRNKDFGKEIEL